MYLVYILENNITINKVNASSSQFVRHLICQAACKVYNMHISYLNFTASDGVGVIMPILQTRKLRPQEGK